MLHRPSVAPDKPQIESAPQQGAYQAPSVASTAAHDNPHFAAVGGSTAVAELVDRFYQHMDTLPEAAQIRSLHPPDLTPVKEVLRRYLTEWLGGPALYSVERGHPRLRRRHLRFPIGAAERDAWMRCMSLALNEVVSDPKLRQELTEAFFKTADFIRNDPDHTHHHHSTQEPSQ
ncbi:MAG TPA: group II truncated hemoglobin [Polyangiaceae bacterium]|nr:group II truncated hemoglobin [Polyangiaceae bacterium]